MMSSLKTKRLLLRPWREQDLEPFAKLNADPEVMKYFPSLLSKKESDRLAERISAPLEQNGWGLWAVSAAEVSDFIGFIGLLEVGFDSHFTPAVEIGWRLDSKYWGKGYATEGALAALKYGFETLRLKEIVSFTSILNKRSIKVMERIGMKHCLDDDFKHPKLPKGHRLSKHVLYRIKSTDWERFS